MPRVGDPAKILIVDDDLGFLVWLGETLLNAGYQPLMTTSVSQAVSWVQELKVEIDLLIINLVLPRRSKLLIALTRQRKPPRLIAITEGPTSTTRGVDGILRKPHPNEPLPEEDCVRTVRETLALGRHAAAS